MTRGVQDDTPQITADRNLPDCAALSEESPSRKESGKNKEVESLATDGAAVSSASFDSAMANQTLCTEVHELPEFSADRCKFAASCEDCRRGEGFVPYIEVIYCAPFAPHLPLALVSVFCLYLFAALAITANDYLCPSLVAISRKLGLSQPVAGVTFLALGNGAPDILAAFTGVSQGRSSLVVSELFGAGTFVTTVVAGYIFFSHRFVVDRWSFLRDVLFYVAAAGLVFSLFKLERVGVHHARLLVGVYALYVVLVLGREAWRAEGSKPAGRGPPPPPLGGEDEALLAGVPPAPRRPSGLNVHHHNAIKVLLGQQTCTPSPTVPRRGSAAASVISREAPQRRPSVPPGVAYESVGCLRENLERLSSETDSFESELGDEEQWSPWKELWLHLVPVSLRELRSASLLGVAWRAAALPIQLWLALTVPVVDYEHEKNNWCKPLNVIHCITAPLAIAWIVSKDAELLDVPVVLLVLPLGFLLAAAVVLTSKRAAAPPYHFGFALLAFLTAVCSVYAACRELMVLLRAFGISQDIDECVLGLTVLAWGSSLGDLVTDSTVARQGYPSMAIAAALGGPMLNLLLGFGLSFGAEFLQTHEPSISVNFPSVLFVLYIALNSSLILSVVFLTCNAFRSSAAHAVALWLLYGLFIVAVLQPDVSF